MLTLPEPFNVRSRITTSPHLAIYFYHRHNLSKISTHRWSAKIRLPVELLLLICKIVTNSYWPIRVRHIDRGIRNPCRLARETPIIDPPHDLLCHSYVTTDLSLLTRAARSIKLPHLFITPKIDLGSARNRGWMNFLLRWAHLLQIYLSGSTSRTRQCLLVGKLFGSGLQFLCKT